jgi:REP element-mobilizing transposase RayT
VAQSLSKVILHIVFSTKNRESIIPQNILSRLHAYMAAVAKDLSSMPFSIGGTENHVHVACTLPRTVSQSDLIKKLKITSSKWMKEQTNLPFAWQSGFGCFSVSRSQIDQLIQYIENQEEHHRYKTFEEEYKEFLNKYEVEFDDRYWLE